MSQIIPVKISFSNIFVVCSWTVVIGKLKTHFLFLTKYPLWENSKEKPSSSHSQNTYCYFDYLLPSLVSSAISLPTHPQPFRPLQSSSFVFFKSWDCWMLVIFILEVWQPSETLKVPPLHWMKHINGHHLFYLLYSCSLPSGVLEDKEW